MMMSSEEFTVRKDRKKRIRVSLQLLILLGLAAWGLLELATFRSYQPYAQTNAAVSDDKGFIALTYSGVDRAETQNGIREARLREHLAALKAQGFVTVTQQDIADYYRSRKNLPEKSLFLMFADGRKGTAVFAQNILEELNFKATMLTYPEDFGKRDTWRLLPDELKNLEKSTFWEMGSNGYRLAFINVFDRHNNYLGELSSLEFARVAPLLKRNYNYWLMDYLRDETGRPKETDQELQERIASDYQALRDTYKKTLGYVPGLYLMHANQNSSVNGGKAVALNEDWLRELFTMSFKRDSFAFNQRNSGVHNLTQLQPQAYWYANHLLMRLQDNTRQEFTFVKGDANRHKAWDTLKGALEIQAEAMIVTSQARDKGLVRLKNSNDFDDLSLSVHLKGNTFGLQKLYVRADDSLNRYVAVSTFNNTLYVVEKNGGAERELLKLNLDRHDGMPQRSVPEDKRAAQIEELETFAKYATSAEQAKQFAERLQEKKRETALSLAEGAPEYVPTISTHAKSDRLLSFSLKGDVLRIMVDGKTAAADLRVSNTKAGSVYLETAWGEYGKPLRTMSDDVYDGVFETLIITDNPDTGKGTILFDSRMQGLDALRIRGKRLWDAVVNWFIVNI